jgi:hypothetical protein
VGFGTKAELDKGLEYTMDGLLAKPVIEEKCDQVARAFEHFKAIQLGEGQDYASFRAAKDTLQQRLAALREELDRYLGKQYGKDADHSAKQYAAWKASHKPFHWFAEYYGIVEGRDGFDVIIGNPPYVEYKPKKLGYEVGPYDTLPCGDLYAYCMERATRVASAAGLMGMIVPISIVSADGFDTLRSLMQKNFRINWFSNYSMRPGKLFEGVEKRLTISLSSGKSTTSTSVIWSTKYHVWSSESRASLFDGLNYTSITKVQLLKSAIPKLDGPLPAAILQKLSGKDRPVELRTRKTSKHVLYHTRKLRYFVQFLNRPPKMVDSQGNSKTTSELKTIGFESAIERDVALAAYNSTLFFWYYLAYSDCRNVNKREVMSFPLNTNSVKENKSVSGLTGRLMKDLQRNAMMQETNYEEYGTMTLEVFQPRLSKPILDEIDALLGAHYGLSEEELDFVINYDIKYRMGDELEGEE